MITLTSVWRADCRVKADRTVRRNCQSPPERERWREQGNHEEEELGLKGQPTRLAGAPAVACEGDKSKLWFGE